jgi:hypothetical protein
VDTMIVNQPILVLHHSLTYINAYGSWLREVLRHNGLF